ncbi:hypothetical protein [Pseudomonas sp. KCJK8993]|uniref:hypothetical protein n=1 Tax=Pseudomonas sp. KCJK8993 TaxID=3344565 RepID=UPI003905C1E0
MRNVDLYGAEKVNKELHQRARALDRLPSDGEKTARIMAWNSFINDLIKVDDRNSRLMSVARIRYDKAVAIFDERGLYLDTSWEQFERHFYNEAGVIARKVTNKWVKAAFYICVALALFGFYKIFS